MANTVVQLFANEGKDPLRIRRWLRLQGYGVESIDLAIAEHAQRIKNGEGFGYVDGISVLAQSIRNRVKKLTMQNEQNISTALGKFKKTVPWYKKKIW